MPKEIVSIKEEHFSYHFDLHMGISHSPVNAVHYKATPDYLDQMAEQESVKLKDKKNSTILS